LAPLSIVLKRWSKKKMLALAGPLILGLGIAAMTSIFGVVNAIVFRPLPFAEPQRLVAVDAQGAMVDHLVFADLQAAAQTFESIAGHISGGPLELSLTSGDLPRRVATAVVSATFLTTLGVKPLYGRDLTSEDEAPFKPWQIVSILMSSALFFVTCGLSIGLSLVTSFNYVLSSILYEVEPSDMQTRLAATLVVGMAAVSAITLSAWSSTRVDPTTALRCE
jgi:hypothetical protein